MYIHNNITNTNINIISKQHIVKTHTKNTNMYHNYNNHDHTHNKNNHSINNNNNTITNTTNS